MTSRRTRSTNQRFACATRLVDCMLPVPVFMCRAVTNESRCAVEQPANELCDEPRAPRPLTQETGARTSRIGFGVGERAQRVAKLVGRAHIPSAAVED